MRGVISLLPLYTFMAWEGKNYNFISSKTTDLHLQDSLSHRISQGAWGNVRTHICACLGASTGHL